MMVLSQVDRFGDPKWVRDYEYRVGKSVIIPFLTQQLGIDLEGKRVLDLGCGSGGTLLTCAEAGSICTGIDRSESRIAIAKSSRPRRGKPPRFIVGDILRPLPSQESFDLVLLIEVVEHLPDFCDVESVLRVAGQLMTQEGKVFVSFPPYRSPFGGHQAGWPVLTYLPWTHLWPKPILHRLAPSEYVEFIEKELNHITLSAFEQCVTRSGLRIEHRALYLLRPEYSVRYGVRAIPQMAFLQKIPFLLESFTTGAYYLLGRGNEVA